MTSGLMHGGGCINAIGPLEQASLSTPFCVARCMTVLTQSPLPISPHALPCPSLASSQPGATAAISMRSYFDNKPRVAETAHIE